MRSRALLSAIHRLRERDAVARLEAQARRRAPGALRMVTAALRRNRVISNVYRRDVRARPRAALSYVFQAFIADQSRAAFLNHSNLWECLEIGRALDDLGYVVDVVDCFDTAFIPKHDYDLFFDIGFNIDRLSSRLPRHCAKVVYITGRHWLAQNAAELERIEAVRRRRRVVLIPRRQAPLTFASEKADALVVLGGERVLESYSHVRAPAFHVAQSVPEALVRSTDRDPSDADRSFLWLGSEGMVHKGLDLVLEVFARRPDLALHVVGPVWEETDFVEAYRTELFRCPNVHVHGRLDVGGDRFREVAAECAALIYPSCSEGTAGAILVSMGQGLVPLVSRESCTEVGESGLTLPNCEIESIEKAIDWVAQMDSHELAARSRQARHWVASRHSREAFAREIREALGAVTAGE